MHMTSINQAAGTVVGTVVGTAAGPDGVRYGRPGLPGCLRGRPDGVRAERAIGMVRCMPRAAVAACGACPSDRSLRVTPLAPRLPSAAPPVVRSARYPRYGGGGPADGVHSYRGARPAAIMASEHRNMTDRQAVYIGRPSPAGPSANGKEVHMIRVSVVGAKGAWDRTWSRR